MKYDIAPGRFGVSLSVPEGKGVPPQEYFARPAVTETKKKRPRMATIDEITKAGEGVEFIRKRHKNLAASRLGPAVGRAQPFAGEITKRKKLDRNVLERIAEVLGLTLEELMDIKKRHAHLRGKIAEAIIENRLHNRKQEAQQKAELARRKQ